jgi:hypothetical protein
MTLGRRSSWAAGSPHGAGQTGEESWYVLADPEENEFCLLRRRRIAPV